MQKPIVDGVKELGRLILFAVISVVVTTVIDYLNGLEPTTHAQLIVGLVAVLRIADKMLLSYRGKEVKFKGLSGF